MASLQRKLARASVASWASTTRQSGAWRCRRTARSGAGVDGPAPFDPRPCSASDDANVSSCPSGLRLGIGSRFGNEASDSTVCACRSRRPTMRPAALRADLGRCSWRERADGVVTATPERTRRARRASTDRWLRLGPVCHRGPVRRCDLVAPTHERATGRAHVRRSAVDVEVATGWTTRSKASSASAW